MSGVAKRKKYIGRDVNSTDPADRPRHGPLAVSWWDAEAGHWRVKITDEGREFAEQFYRRYPKSWVGPAKRIDGFMVAVDKGAISIDDARSAGWMGILDAVRLYPGPGLPSKAWVWNRILSRLGRLMRQRVNPDPIEKSEPIDVDHPSPPFESPDHLLVGRLRECLPRLPDDQREAAERYFGLNGYAQDVHGYYGVASGMGCGETTARRLVGRAVQNLRMMMGDVRE